MKCGAVGLAVPLLPLLLSTGCVHDYSSPNRTGQGPDYARQVFSLYDPGAGGSGGAGAGAARGEAMKFPASVAVAEVGELHPPPVLLEQLRKEPGLFRRVEGIPGIADGDAVTSPFNMRDYPTSPSGSPGNRDDAGQAAAAMRRLIRFARDMGMDYLMLFGATVDSDAHATELSAFDLTIVGAYVVPSRKLSGRARASAVLVDLRGDRVVLSAGTEADGNRMVPAVTEEGRQESLVKKLRDQAFGSLGKQLIASCKARTGVALAAPEGGAGDPFAGASANAKASNAPPALSGGDGGFKPLPPDPVPARR